MLALYPLRSQLHSSRFYQIRTIRTVPRTIPTYIKRWDPTQSKPIRARPFPTEQEGLAETVPNSDVQVAEHRKQREEDNKYALQRGPETIQRRAYKRLSDLLALAASSTHNLYLRKPLWSAYASVRSHGLQQLNLLPDRAWDILWTTQSMQANKHRRLHLKQLCEDMDVLGRSVPTTQRVQYIEETFLEGREEEALHEWENDYQAASRDIGQETEPDLLELGAKLHALVNNVDRSRALMEKLFSLRPDRDPSVMMTVFRAHTSSELLHHHVIANDIYATMRSRKGEAVTLEDYDAWLVGFLEARHLTYAKQVFRDMVKSGRLTTTCTAQHVEEALKRLHLLYRLGTDISRMTSIALDVISVLPFAYHSYVFGHWMKSAVDHKAPEASAQILDMMFKQGPRPETIHFNMLLKALLRTKEYPNVLKAENIGWRMIEEARKAHKRTLKPESASEVISKNAGLTPKQHQPFDASAARAVPVGNVTTFALIMHHHAKSLQWEHVSYLTRQLKASATRPNATIMNVLIDNHCRQGAYADAWRTYSTLTNPPDNEVGVFPDGATFRHLWKTLRLALGDHATRSDPYLPSPRELLRETMAWWSLTRSRYDAPRFRQGLVAADAGAIARLILHCFSYTQDLPGSLVALHILRSEFGVLPTQQTAEILLRQLAWVEMARESASERSQYFHSRSNATNTRRIQRVYEILRQRRVERMGGGEWEGLSEVERGEARLNLLSEFVRVVLKRSYTPDIVELMIDVTRSVVGMPTLETGDLTAEEVL